jgi:protein-tyrosine kinase
MSIIEKAIRRTMEAEAAKSVTMVAAPKGHSGTPSLGTLTRGNRVVDLQSEALRTAGLFPPEGQARIRRNEFRSIKTPLIAAASVHSANHPGQRASVAAVVSSLPGEGKTYVSLNLASSLAFECDVTTIIIDGDVARHKLSTLLGVHDLPGFSDFLSNEKLALADVLLPTNEASVFVMPAGKWREDIAELVASARMRALLEGISQAADRPLIILDCPPLLVTSEAAALMAIADQTLFIVRAGHSQQSTVEEAAAKLDRGKPIHVVLNAWQPLSIAERTYYSKYRDYYGSGE